ncbi:hypothetical protein ABPG75_000418 [Micractinium tetrahymenae]
MPIPPQLASRSAADLHAFVWRRRHLFLRCRGSDRVALVPGAQPFLRYKRCLLQYLADHPPRVELARLEGAVPKPAGLASDVGALFIRKFLSCEVWQLGSTSYRLLQTAELCPFPAGPLYRPACRGFDGLIAPGCPDQERCPLAHARLRPFL